MGVRAVSAPAATSTEGSRLPWVARQRVGPGDDLLILSLLTLKGVIVLGNQDLTYRQKREALANAKSAGTDRKEIAKLQAATDAAYEDLAESHRKQGQPIPQKLH